MSDVELENNGSEDGLGEAVGGDVLRDDADVVFEKHSGEVEVIHRLVNSKNNGNLVNI